MLLFLRIFIKNNDIPLEDRQAVVARVARPNISHFLSEKENVLARSTQNSVAYCRTVLYDYLVQQQAKDDAQPQQSDIIPLWEEIWLKQKEEIRVALEQPCHIQNLRELGGIAVIAEITDHEFARYAEVVTDLRGLLREGHEQLIRRIGEIADFFFRHA